MAITTYDDAAVLADFTTDPGVKENSRIIGIVLIKKGFDITALDDTEATWDTGITAKDLVIINPVTGNFPEATENSVPGIGRTQTEFSNKTYNIPFRHKGVDVNLAFYNKLLKSKEYGIGFMFHDNKMYVPAGKDLEVATIDFFCRVASEEDLEGDRYMMVSARWNSADFPYSFAAPKELFPL